MQFEFNQRKSEINKSKHGIDFIEAQKLWNKDVLELIATKAPEKRFLHIGKIENKLFTAVITYRNNNVRIISVRRSRRKEIEYYEKNINK